MDPRSTREELRSRDKLDLRALLRSMIEDEELSSMSSGAHGRDGSTEPRHSVEEQSTPAVKRKCTRDEDITTQGPGLPSISAEVVLPSGVLQSSGYQYPLPHGGVGEHQSRIIPSQLVQQGVAPPSGMLQPGGYQIPPSQYPYSTGGGHNPSSIPSQLQQGFAPHSGMLHASGCQILPPQHFDSGYQPPFMPSQQGFAGPHENLLQNSCVGGYPPIYAQHELQETLSNTLAGHQFMRCQLSHDCRCDVCKGSILPDNGLNCTQCQGTVHAECVDKLDKMCSEMKVLKPLRESIKGNNVNSFHRHLKELGMVVQNNERMRELLEEDGVVCLGAHLGTTSVVETLIQKGVDINTMSTVPEHPYYDDDEMSPLHWASERDHVNTVKFLVENGANLHSKDGEGFTPLHRAAIRGYTDAVQYLIDKGGGINIKNVNGWTPLHLAAWNGRVETARLLVEKGADINVETDDWDTPLDLAAEKGHEKVVAYLKRTADPNMLGESESTGRQEQRPSLQETAGLRTVLKRYTVKAKPTGIDLGSGTYGRVIELSSASEIVAGKVFKSSSNIYQQTLTNKLFGELSLLTQVHHPNIVQCKGVCFLDNETMPVLLMERMMSSLHSYLLEPTNLNITLERKLSILCDVASGLLYLHSHKPAIIHRDLTANNILLDSEQRAKISDFGNARLMDLDPEATPGIFTSLPGTPDYMPPEAQDDSAKCGPSLDVFSFGHLSLFTIIQSLVHPLLPSTYIDAGEVCGRSEVKRRKQYLDKAGHHLKGNPSVVVLIKQCLHNDSAQRPPTAELERRLQDILISMKILSQSTTSAPEQLTRVQVTSGAVASSETGQLHLQPPSTPAFTPVDILGDRPNLLKLLRFPSKKGNINIPEQISTKYLEFGILLLNDETGAKVSAIVSKHHEDAKQINLEILKLWIEGKGNLVSWNTLISVLKAVGLVALASDIKEGLQH